MMSDTIIDVPLNDSDYDYCKEDKLREEAEQAMRGDSCGTCVKCGEEGYMELVGDEVDFFCPNCNK